MGMMRRIEKLEQAADNVDWHAHLPEGVTVAEAEALMDAWARLAAGYADARGVPLAEAMDATRDAAIALVKGGQVAEGDDDDDDDEL